MDSEYAKFLEGRTQSATGAGFEPVWMPDFLFDFQKHLVEWSIRKGRAALFEDCGLGKTPQQLVWAENVVRHTNKPVLILAPLAVSAQTVREAEKFGVDCRRCQDGTVPTGARVLVTNYERLHYFSPADFAGVVCDESSILKNSDGVTRKQVTEFMRTLPYRLLCTATAAPNDYIELGTSAEAIGEMGFQDMITKFFRQIYKGDHRGWSRLKYRLRNYAETDFWRWVCSWARAIRKPSDCGFADDKFKLPPLVCVEHEVKASVPQPGRLFEVTAVTLEEQREEQRRTLPDRCGKVADLVGKTKKPALCWTHLNDEGAEICRLVKDAVEVSGADDDDAKEEKLLAFVRGEIRVLVTKPKVAGFGLNFQHCAHQTYFPSHSFEQWYQGVRRCWRFGQKNKVRVDMVTTEGGAGVLENLNRKTKAAEEMFERLVELMNNALRIERKNEFTKKTRVPQWL